MRLTPVWAILLALSLVSCSSPTPTSAPMSPVASPVLPTSTATSMPPTKAPGGAEPQRSTSTRNPTDTPLPTQTARPTGTPAPTATPKAELSARLETEEYFSGSMAWTNASGRAMTALGELIQEPELSDADWRVALLIQSAVLRLAYAQTSEMSPPEEARDIHSQLLAGMADCQQALDRIAAGVDDQDVSAVRKASQLIEGANAKVNAAAELLQAQWGEPASATPPSPSPRPTHTHRPPTAPSTPSPTCQPALAFVRDVTIPDDAELQPETGFVKTWAVKNAGTCKWEEHFVLRFVDGEQMGAPASVPMPIAEPGEVVEVSVSMKAPVGPGRHRGVWKLCAGDQCFGTGLTVRIITVAAEAGCPGGCTEERPRCSIKGNISKSGEKIYHMPGQQYYDKTKIDPSKGERWFCTEEEAQAAGWRKSKL